MVRPSQDEDDDAGKFNDTYTGRNWVEGPPSDSLQSASEHQLDIRHKQRHRLPAEAQTGLCAATSVSVWTVIHLSEGIPCNLLFCWLSCCFRAEVHLIAGITDLSHSSSLCHCGVATVVNVVREPQVAFTLQPYLWLASWNEHSPYCMCTHTWRHTQTHTCL